MNLTPLLQNEKLKEKKITEFCCRTSCRSFLLLTESRFISRFIHRNVIQGHKVAYFYDVGSTYAIDQKINH
jgi:hypothetical protein